MKDATPAMRAEFKKKLLDSILRLTKEADGNTLINNKIREEIRGLAVNHVSTGQAQKVINVYMKYYCILREKTGLLRELDCPIDSGIAKVIWETLTPEDKKELSKLLPSALPFGYAYSFFSKLININYPLYEFFQKCLEKMGSGIRIKPDIEVYDRRRIQDFLSNVPSQ